MSNDTFVSEMSTFKDAMTCALFIDVVPHSFIPFINIRKVTRIGMLRFVKIFSGRSASSMAPAAAGLSSGSDTVVVVKLEEKDYHLSNQSMNIYKRRCVRRLTRSKLFVVAKCGTR